jgi:hypothetical protein
MAFAAHAPLADNGFGKVESNRKNASRRQPDQELRINEEDRFATTRDVLIVRGGARAGENMTCCRADRRMTVDALLSSLLY